MKTTTLLLLCLAIAISSLGQSNQAEMTLHKMSYTQPTEDKTTLKHDMMVMSSPAKDTLYMVKGTTSNLIVTIWMTPEFDKTRPVFTYITEEEMKALAKMPRYARRD